MNALRHGLTAKALVLTNESMAKFDELLQHYITKFQPADDVEMDLVDDMVAARWRIRRIWTLKTAALDLQMDNQEEEIKKTFTNIDQPTRAVVAFNALANNEKSLQLLLRYETTYNRMYHRAMKTLLELQKDRIRHEEPVTSEELRNDPKPSPPIGDEPGVAKEMELPRTPESPAGVPETRPSTPVYVINGPDSQAWLKE
jgi:hypothetical protein